jgi:hypothetical protein
MRLEIELPMSQYFRILCASDNFSDAKEISDFVRDGFYFDCDPQITVFGSDPWNRIEIQYDKSRRPIIVHKTVNGHLLKDELKEIKNATRKMQSEIENHLDRTSTIFAIEVNRLNVTEEAWKMLDGLDSFIASRCGGIIYIPEEGFYNAELKLVQSIVP